jgi:hypothetical protein
MKKLLANDNVLMLGVGVVAFIGVKYLMKMQEEKKSNAIGAFTSQKLAGSSGGNCGCDVYGEFGTYPSNGLPCWQVCNNARKNFKFR